MTVIGGNVFFLTIFMGSILKKVVGYLFILWILLGLFFLKEELREGKKNPLPLRAL